MEEFRRPRDFGRVLSPAGAVHWTATRSSSAFTAALAEPARAHRPQYLGRSAYLLNELGIAIIFPNVRGSWGFGKAFGRLDDGTEA